MMKAGPGLKIPSNSLFLVFVIFSAPKSTLGATKDNYYDLYTKLFDAGFYNSDVRPVDDEMASVLIFMELHLLSLVEVAEKDQKLVTNARLVLEWYDGILSWEPSDYGDIESLMVPQKKIWLPDVVVGNGVTAQTRLGYDALPVRLHSGGAIEWQPSLLLSTACNIEITYFPFDTQKCKVTFETALSTFEEVDINIDKSHPIVLQDFSEDGQWELKSTSAKNLNNENGKSKIQYTLVLARRRTFYLIYIILPIFFLSLTSSLIFALPADGGEKVSAGITVLLSFAVYLGIVADLVPNTSLQVSVLGVYLALLLGYSALSLIICVFVLRLHFRDNSTSVGSKTKKIVILLRKVTFMTAWESFRNSVAPMGSGDIGDTNNSRKRHNLSQPHLDSLFLEEKMTWPVVAATLDWLFFILFSTLTIATTIVCMSILEFGSNVKTS